MGATPVTLNTGVPATIQPALQSAIDPSVIGEKFAQTDLLILDGLGRADYAAIAPGGSVVVGAITYKVTANGRGAFPDLRADDKVVDEAAIEYLVLSVRTAEYTRTLQARLARGKAWAS
jgi:hypothetical protein